MLVDEEFYEKNIMVFLVLLMNKLPLFSLQDLVEVQQLIDNLPDDIEEISKTLCAWYEKRQKICIEQFKLLKTITKSDIQKIMETERLDIDKNGDIVKPKTLGKEIVQEIVQNAIKKFSEPTDDNQSSQSEK